MIVLQFLDFWPLIRLFKRFCFSLAGHSSLQFRTNLYKKRRSDDVLPLRQLEYLTILPELKCVTIKKRKRLSRIIALSFPLPVKRQSLDDSFLNRLLWCLRFEKFTYSISRNFDLLRLIGLCFLHNGIDNVRIKPSFFRKPPHFNGLNMRRSAILNVDCVN